MRKFLAGVALVAALLGLGAGSASASPRPEPTISGSAVVHVAAPTPTATAPILPESAGNGVGQQVVLAGDSITAGWLLPVDSRLDARLGYRLCGRACGTAGQPTITNKGVGGQQLLGQPGADLSSTWASIIAPLAAGDIVIVDIGINDCYAYAGDLAWTNAYVSIVSQAQAKGIQVLIGQITPVGPSRANIEALRERLNTWLADRFGTMVIRYPDVLHRYDAPYTAYINVQMIEPDQIHPNEFGTMEMADLAYPRVLALLN
jgi:lysophospholipase L1-like esterase